MAAQASYLQVSLMQEYKRQELRSATVVLECLTCMSGGEARFMVFVEAASC